jgi:hypothetical protein
MGQEGIKGPKRYKKDPEIKCPEFQWSQIHMVQKANVPKVSWSIHTLFPQKIHGSKLL